MESTTTSLVKIYTDGACSGNPGPGGWGVVIRYTEDNKIISEETFSGKENKTTNNRMELTAAIKALEILDERNRSDKVTIYIDSKYVKTGITEWIVKWKVNNWCGSNKKPVKNTDLWKELDTLCQGKQIDWTWVKGHGNNEGNNLADKLARGI